MKTFRLLLFWLAIFSSQVHAQLPAPQSKTLKAEAARDIALKAYRQFSKPPRKNEYYRIIEEADQVILYYAYMGQAQAPTHLEQYIYKGKAAACTYDEAGPDPIFTCHSLEGVNDNNDLYTQAKFGAFGHSSITASVRNDYVKFNPATFALERVTDPVLFEKENYSKTCARQLSTEACGVLIDQIIKDLPANGTWAQVKFNFAGLSKENLKLLSSLATNGTLEAHLRLKYKSLQTFVSTAGDTSFWFDTEKYDDEGIQTYVVLGLSKAKSISYVFALATGKYSACTPGKKMKDQMILNCSYAEGGEESNWIATIDFAKRTIK